MQFRKKDPSLLKNKLPRMLKGVADFTAPSQEDFLLDFSIQWGLLKDGLPANSKVLDRIKHRKSFKSPQILWIKKI